MSESDSDVAEQDQHSSPETPTEIFKEIFIRILAGLGAVGRGLRGGFVTTGTCVQHTVYPIKQGCVYGYDEAMSYFNPSAARPERELPPETAVCFSQYHEDPDEAAKNLSIESNRHGKEIYHANTLRYVDYKNWTSAGVPHDTLSFSSTNLSNEKALLLPIENVSTCRATSVQRVIRSMCVAGRGRSQVVSCTGVINRHYSNESFLNGDSASYIEHMYTAWLQDSSSVHASWDAYFKNTVRGVSGQQLFCLAQELSAEDIGNQFSAMSTDKDTQLMQMVENYRRYGHLYAKVDPLSLSHDDDDRTRSHAAMEKRRLNYHSHGFTTEDLNRELMTMISSGLQSRLLRQSRLKLGELVTILEKTYCGSIGVQLSHIEDPRVLEFFTDALESKDNVNHDSDTKRRIFVRLANTQLFENFCTSKFNVMKRFGVEGCESAIIAMEEIVDRAASVGVRDVVIGLSHRGRINVLANVVKKPLQNIFVEFQGITDYGQGNSGKTGDVKYHLGGERYEIHPKTQQKFRVRVLPNPSHLCAVNPVVLGYTKALQDDIPDHQHVLPILMHGDASFCGQGINYEIAQMAKLRCYNVGGTIHIITNNQIGFTTDMIDQRSCQYPTDIMKLTGAPIFHVNADDPEACTRVAQLALDYRQQFHSDIILNIVGYRRFGHNELDMPKFTQPFMYHHIEQHPPVLDIYAKQLQGEGIFDAEEVTNIKGSILSEYDQEYEKSKVIVEKRRDAIRNDISTSLLLRSEGAVEENKTNEKNSTNGLTNNWNAVGGPRHPLIHFSHVHGTGVTLNVLREVGLYISTLPPWLKPHPTIQKVYAARRDAIVSQENLDFGLAEALAFATLLRDGFSVRLVGQDCQRGTFSHRHAVVHNQHIQKTNTKDTVVKDTDAKEQDAGSKMKMSSFCPLHDLTMNICQETPTDASGAPQHEKLDHQGDSAPKFTVSNSLLSEYAALGFETGYVLARPNTLCIWEAQFGDFANGAQIIIDQYVASAETKWGSKCGLVLFLPHGYDGQGPEHSSGRIERFLQLCDGPEDVINIQLPITKDPPEKNHNLQVVNCTTPANFFHVLRRQMHRTFRKPLVVFTPKRLLRMRAAYSRLTHIQKGTFFLPYIPNVVLSDTSPHHVSCHDDALAVDESIDRLVVCSGQVYYDLLSFREKHNRRSVAIARIEQLSPFPFHALLSDIQRYPNLKHIVWAQEEPMNMGPWSYVSPRLSSVLKLLEPPQTISSITYAGRDACGAPAVGDLHVHEMQLNRLLRTAIGDVPRHSVV